MKLVLNSDTEDRVFEGTSSRGSDFEFNREVASVFDDMLVRSVPFYVELQYMIKELAVCFATEGTNIYDLGSSTGTTLINICQVLKEKNHYVGIDNSQPMIEKAKEKVIQSEWESLISFQNRNIDETISLQNASVVTMCWTLQFIRPLIRKQVLERVFASLKEGGAFILVEKVLANTPDLNRLYIETYYNFKRRNKYREEEIVRKREALENVLVPYRIDENIRMLRESGFRIADTFFQWYNFAAFLCVK